MTNIRARVHEILAEQAMIDVADVTDDQSPQDLGVDSMAKMVSTNPMESTPKSWGL
ncbi:MAG: hypothetical protein AAGK57_11605 [Pseudomonadota bacterium]